MKTLMVGVWLILVSAGLLHAQAPTINNPIFHDYEDLTGKGWSKATQKNCGGGISCLQLVRSIDVLSMPVYKDGADTAARQQPFSLQVAAIVDPAWADPEILTDEPWMDINDLLQYDPDPEPGPGPYLPSPPGSLLTWVLDPAVALAANAANPAPAGQTWIGFSSSPVIPNVPQGIPLKFRISFVWENLPLGSDAATGAIWLTDDADALYGISVRPAHTEVGPADVILPGEIGTTVTFADFNGTGFDAAPGLGQLNTTHWRISGFSDGNKGFGTNAVGGDYARGLTAGGIITGGIYALSTPLMQGMLIQPTALDFNPGSVTKRFLNSSTDTINALEIGYEIFVLNNGSRSNVINFSYSDDDSIYLKEEFFEIVTPEVADFTGSVYRIGTTLEDLTIPPGSYFYMRWEGDDSSGVGQQDEFAFTKISARVAMPMMCDPSVTPIANAAIDRTLTDSVVILDWQLVPGSVGCQIKGGRVVGPGGITKNLIGMNLSSFTVPSSAFVPGVLYEYETRCACELTPAIVGTPLSAPVVFGVPPRLASGEIPALPKMNVEVYPNPASNLLQVEKLDGAIETITISARDGRTIREMDFSGLGQVQLDVSDLAEGFYWIQVNGSAYHGFVISR